MRRIAARPHACVDEDVIIAVAVTVAVAVAVDGSLTVAVAGSRPVKPEVGTD